MVLEAKLEEAINLLNKTYYQELEVRFQEVRRSFPFKLLAELVREYDLKFYGDPALVRAEVHNLCFLVPHKGLGRALRFIEDHDANVPSAPITPFMKLAGIKTLDHWKDYYPGWEEYLDILGPEKQQVVAQKMRHFNLAGLKITGGDNCAGLYWQKELGERPSEIHSAWLILKPRSEFSLREMLWTPRPKTEEQWRNAILKKYQGENI